VSRGYERAQPNARQDSAAAATPRASAARGSRPPMRAAR
jgi:hypothetical protein